MHFVDRNTFANAPTVELSQLHLDEQQKWLDYKDWLNTKVPPPVNKPTSKWTRDSVRNPLTKLFKNNCAYCGNYSDKNNDGEVDHFYPKELDTTANLIYAWNNYVWACHSCNNKKRNHYPLINPCDANETAEIYFHSSDGRYLVYSNASNDIKAKYKLTEEQTYINGKKCPERRKNIYKQLEAIYLKDISRYKELYDLEFSIDPNSNETNEMANKLDQAKQNLKEFLKTEDFILLKMQTIEKYRQINVAFTYTYDDFIES